MHGLDPPHVPCRMVHHEHGIVVTPEPTTMMLATAVGVTVMPGRYCHGSRVNVKVQSLLGTLLAMGYKRGYNKIPTYPEADLYFGLRC